MKNLKNAGEKGSARLKFILVMMIISAGGFVAYKMVPIAYQSYIFKDWMQHNVNVAATQGYQPTWIRDQLAKSLPEYGVPPTAVIEPVNRNGRMEVRVHFTTPVEFPGYIYEYEFDYTARSTAFLTTAK